MTLLSDSPPPGAGRLSGPILVTLALVAFIASLLVSDWPLRLPFLAEH